MTVADTPTTPAGAFDRDGHLSALALERYLHEGRALPLAGAAAAAHEAHCATVEGHLATCATCAARVVAMRTMNATPLVVPPGLRQRTAQAKVVQLRPRLIAAAAVAIAAVALVAVALPPTMSNEGEGRRAAAAVDGLAPTPVAPESELRRKGGSFDVGFWVHDGRHERAVNHGDVVRGGERVGFRVWSRTAGYLLIAGVDTAGPAYRCHPQQGDDAAAAVSGGDRPQTLPAAMRFDNTPGLERLVAIRCDEPFTLGDIRAALERSGHNADPETRLPLLRAGCAQRQVTLRKAASTAPPGGARP